MLTLTIDKIFEMLKALLGRFGLNTKTFFSLYGD